jgi:hypothetical protein
MSTQPTPKHPEKNIHGQKSSPWATKESGEDPETTETTETGEPAADPDPEPKQDPYLGAKDPAWIAWHERHPEGTEKGKGKGKGKAPAAPATPATEETETA